MNFHHLQKGKWKIEIDTYFVGEHGASSNHTGIPKFSYRAEALWNMWLYPIEFHSAYWILNLSIHLIHLLKIKRGNGDTHVSAQYYSPQPYTENLAFWCTPFSSYCTDKCSGRWEFSDELHRQLYVFNCKWILIMNITGVCWNNI